MSYLIARLASLLNSFFIVVPTVLISLMGHELAHGWVSMKLGDPTPKAEGRMTINPLKHLDPLGTILMIVTGFGWAKPVRVNPMYYKNRKAGMAIVAFAGPLANLLMATAGMVLGFLLLKLFGASKAAPVIVEIVQTFVSLNLGLMVFNLIPLPPLDGSKILGMILPNRAYYTMLQYEQYAIFILLILSVTGVFDTIIGTGVGILWNAVWNFASMIVL